MSRARVHNFHRGAYGVVWVTLRFYQFYLLSSLQVSPCVSVLPMYDTAHLLFWKVYRHQFTP